MDVIKVTRDILYFYKEGDIYPFSAAAVVKGRKAFVFDTLDGIKSASFMKNYLMETCFVKEFIVVNSHWHWDHVGGNSLFKDSIIMSHEVCRREMEINREELSERFEVTYPNLIIRGNTTIYVGSLRLEVIPIVIHTRDSMAVYIPEYKILLAGDTLESPLPYIDEVEDLRIHIGNLKKFKEMDIDMIVPSHGDIYDMVLVDANIEYLEGLLRDVDEEDFFDRPMEQYVKKGIKLRESYRKIHRSNMEAVAGYYG